MSLPGPFPPRFDEPQPTEAEARADLPRMLRSLEELWDDLGLAPIDELAFDELGLLPLSVRARHRLIAELRGLDA